MKKKLIVICAPDRCGKDYLLDHLGALEGNVYVYKQKNNPPHYRKDPAAFKIWLEDFLGKQANHLIVASKDVVMARLFTSEYVYSTLFNRTSIINDIYNKLNYHFDIYQVILLYKDYNEYLGRCKMLNEEIEYNKEDFDKIQNLYLTSKFNSMADTYIHIGCSYDVDVMANIIRGILNEKPL